MGVLFCALAGPASAAPCWKSVVLDWAADGSVDRTYPIACYHQAIANLQPDLELYSSAGDDIRRALQRVVTVSDDPAATTPTTGTPTTSTPTTTDNAPAATTATPPPDTSVAVQPTGDGDSVPLPLLALGGLALLLVAVGVAGIVRRRMRGDDPSTP